MTMTISAFGDETAVDFEEQLQLLTALGIKKIDVRTAWGVNCAEFTDEHLEKINALCEQYGVEVACIGSPIGKSPIQEDIRMESDRVRFVANVAKQLGTKNIRIFSFYPEGDVTADVMQDSIQRLQTLTAIAEELDVQLLLENEKELVGDVPARCLEIMQAIDSDHIKFIWDPANFVQCGAEEQVATWWDELSPYIGYIHIKDALLADGAVTPAGEGDGQVALLLAKLLESGYDDVLSLEPHLAVAGHSTGYSGPEGMNVAVTALRKLMNEAGIEEV
jgi:sugar phosphate isomerase/epimerase